MILQLNPPLPMISPKGKCLCVALIDYGIEYNIHWVCIQDDTGECWTWSNPEIRGQKNTTYGRENISPFYDPKDAALPRYSTVEFDDWIDVNDELPEEDILVLCYNKPSTGFECFTAFYDEKTKCWRDPAFKSWALNVTYWKPLPEYPIPNKYVELSKERKLTSREVINKFMDDNGIFHPKEGIKITQPEDSSVCTIRVNDDWIDVDERKPLPSDSPIIATKGKNYFDYAALQYIEGWSGYGWYKSCEEYGMSLNKDEAFFDKFGCMKYWKPLLEPPIPNQE